MVMKVYSKLSLLCFFFLSPLHSASPLKVDVSAKSAVLVNAETGAVLWEKNASTPIFPASTTKVITALYAIEKKGGALEEMVEASFDAVACVPAATRRAERGGHPPYRLEYGGTHMGIKAGEILPLRTLFYGLMLSSGNDAANVIAEYVSGSIPRFMEGMNRYVQEKGCQNTVLHTPHGLPWEEHKTTARDMAVLAREFLKHPFLCEVAKSTYFIRPQTNKQAESRMTQFNALLKPGKFFYSKAFGIKTGYTEAAGYTLVTAAKDENRTLIAALFGCEKIEQRYSDAIALFEAAFNEKKVSRTLFSKGFDLFSCPVEGGKLPLQAGLAEDLLLHYYPSEEPVFKTAVLWQVPSLPITPNQQVAEMQVLSTEGKVLMAAPLYAIKGVEATLLHQCHLGWQKVKKGLWDHLALVMVAIGLVVIGGSYYYTHRPSASRRAK
jgi:serine-type D-Ala-D-Ala carboxypeptidase (penicillin-binding protein 5/6)